MPSTTLLQSQAEVKAVEDQITDTAHQIENLSPTEAISIAREMIEAGEYHNFKLGGLLVRISEEAVGYDNFESLLVAEFPSLKKRKAQYLMRIYTNLIAAEVAWGSVSHIGWSKLKEIAKVITKENAAEWIKKAEELTLIQLIEAVRQHTTGESTPGATDDGDGLSSITFKVYPEQKETIKGALEKAKVEAGTEFDGVAIECICLSYLTGSQPTKVTPPKVESLPVAATFEEQVLEMGYAKALGVISEKYPELSIKVTVTKTD